MKYTHNLSLPYPPGDRPAVTPTTITGAPDPKKHRAFRKANHNHISKVKIDIYRLAEVPSVSRVLNEPFRNNRIVHRYHIKLISIWKWFPFSNS